jgi:HlyD family secretion protein
MDIGDIEGDLEVIVKLLSTDAVQVSAGDKVVIDDWGGATVLQGEVARVDPFGFTQFSALGVEEQRVNTVIQFTENSHDFKNLGHGYRVETRIVVWEGQDILKVPSSALFRSSDSWAVFKVDNGAANIELIEIGNNNGTEAEVLDGLEPQDQVILFPSSGLSDGMKVVQRQVN